MVYLQKRAKDAQRLPGYFGFFGGGIEVGETPEQGLVREMQEEVGVVLEGYTYFKSYEFERGVVHVFYLQASQDFETRIRIEEGEYGQWFSESEIVQEPLLIGQDKMILRELVNMLRELQKG